jgi:GNAT superfamily N-acetyltransferase
MKKFHVRAALPSDAAEIAKLNLLFNQVDAPAAVYAARLEDERRVDTPILAVIDGAAVGIANVRILPAVFYREPYAELTELFVIEEYRRQGIGKALIEFAESLAQSAGAEEMVLLTGPENQAARSLYLQMGYHPLDIAMSKRL